MYKYALCPAVLSTQKLRISSEAAISYQHSAWIAIREGHLSGYAGKHSAISGQPSAFSQKINHRGQEGEQRRRNPENSFVILCVLCG
jgi:hypothetical protein